VTRAVVFDPETVADAMTPVDRASLTAELPRVLAGR
jgi:hypothetical protein